MSLQNSSLVRGSVEFALLTFDSYKRIFERDLYLWGKTGRVAIHGQLLGMAPFCTNAMKNAVKNTLSGLS